MDRLRHRRCPAQRDVDGCPARRRRRRAHTRHEPLVHAGGGVDGHGRRCHAHRFRPRRWRPRSPAVRQSRSTGDGAGRADRADRDRPEPGDDRVLAGAPWTTVAAAITSYTARAWDAGSGGSYGSRTCTPAPATGLTCTITGLTNGDHLLRRRHRDQRRRIRALPPLPARRRQPIGTGAPSQPRSIAASSADQSLLVTWQAPSSSGGSAITSYTATAWSTAMRRDGTAHLHAESGDRSRLHHHRPDQRDHLLRRRSRHQRLGGGPALVTAPGGGSRNGADRATQPHRRPCGLVSDRHLAGAVVQRGQRRHVLHRPSLDGSQRRQHRGQLPAQPAHRSDVHGRRTRQRHHLLRGRHGGQPRRLGSGLLPAHRRDPGGSRAASVRRRRRRRFELERQ